ATHFAESSGEGDIATWYKKEGEAGKRGELMVDMETEKVVIEVVAPSDSVLTKVRKGEGDVVDGQEVIACLDTEAKAEVAPAAEDPAAATPAAEEASDDDPVAAPAARKLISEQGLDISAITGTGKGGRITKEDVQAAVQARDEKRQASAPAASQQQEPAQVPLGEREERRVPMTRLRKRIAERLLAAQHNSAMLTTFNEVNMEPIMNMRKSYQA